MTTEKTNQFIGMLDNVSYELAERVLLHRLANRQWHVGDRFAYITDSDADGSYIEFGTVTEVKGDRIWGRLDEEPTRDVMFGRTDMSIGCANTIIGVDLSLAECDTKDEVEGS